MHLYVSKKAILQYLMLYYLPDLPDHVSSLVPKV